MSPPLCWVEVSWRQGGQQARLALAQLGVARDVPALTLQTCARTGWLLAGPGAEGAGARLARRIRAGTGVAPVEHQGARAIHHLLYLASGLDSAAEGELDVGRQTIAALGAARAQHPDAPFGLVEHVLYRLLRRGRREGWIRARTGVPEAASTLVLAREPRSVGVIGAGAMGERVQVALTRAGAPFGWYNRTVRPGLSGLDALPPHEAWIVTTGAGSAWFEAPAGARLVVDLGQPPQALPHPQLPPGGLLLLDALLDAAALRLTERQRQDARAAVEASAQDLLARLRRYALPRLHDQGPRP